MDYAAVEATYRTMLRSETEEVGEGGDLVSDFEHLLAPEETVDETTIESETIASESEDAEPTKVNYIADFYKNKDHDYNTFFSGATSSTEEIDKLNKEIRKFQKKINETSNKIQEIYSKQYKKNYTPASQTMILSYKDRSYNKHYYSVPSGQSIDLDMFNENEYILYDLDTKIGEIKVLGGYAYELGSLVIKNFKYSVSGDNQTCKMSIINECLVGFLEDIYVDSTTGISLDLKKGLPRDLWKIDSQEFIQTLYGIDKPIDYKLGDMLKYKRENKAFETILKLAPAEIMNPMLYENFSENKSIPELIGISKNTYKDAIDRGIIQAVYEMAPTMHEAVFKKTEADWLGLIERCKKYETDLSFYEILYGAGGYYYGNKRGKDNSALIRLIADAYAGSSVFSENYSFPKFIDYVVRGTIDQGYSNIGSFITELRDYLKMCKEGGYAPTLYSSYLKQTHDIASRNHKLNVSPEAEAKFKDIMDDFKPFQTKKKDFIILAPNCTHALKAEGDALNHCVASYIKRVIDGDCKILFLRRKADESLITLEVRGNQIVQARGEHNRNPYEDEIAALKEFCEDRDLECNY